MKLYIRNMVCDRCRMVVDSELRQLGLHPLQVALGEVMLQESSVTPAQQTALAERLHTLGFELTESRRARIVEGIKAAVIRLIHQNDADTRIKYSEYLSQKLGLDYAYLSKVFSEEQGTTVEHYIILQKLERVKELLSYGEMTLSEIALDLGYSSVAALSSQFRKVMGLTTTAWKESSAHRQTLDRVGRAAQH